MNGSKQWWEAHATNWGEGEPARVVELFSAAYEERSDIEGVVSAAGFDPRIPRGASSAREMWTWVFAAAAAKGRALDLAAVMLNDTGRAAFHALLIRLLGDRLQAVAKRSALRYGLSVSTDVGRVIIESLETAVIDPPDEPVSQLEAITAASTGFDSPRQYIQALLDAVSRTALIELAGRPAGTGFLVGPDLLLTAAHVLDPEHWPPSGARRVAARFDFEEVPGASPAESGVVVAVTGFIAGSLPTSKEVAGIVDQDWNAPVENLDFALLRLARPVGSARRHGGPRGWYTLDPAGYGFDRSSLYFIVQHPVGQSQKISFIKSPPQTNQPVPSLPTRIKYRSNTLAGSSGSPVVDFRGKLVALHHYSAAASNQGVPISVIASTLEHAHPELFGAVPLPAAMIPVHPVDVDPFDTLDVAGFPFVDRTPFRENLRRIARPESNHYMVITGGPRSGISHSYSLISYVASEAGRCSELTGLTPDGVEAVRIDLRRYGSTPVEQRRSTIAGDVLVSLGLSRADDPLAQEPRNVASFAHYLGAELKRHHKQVWLFVDSIDDEVAFRQGSVDELVDALIELATDPQVPLRIVLAGQAAAHVKEKHPWLRVAPADTASGFTQREAEEWIRAKAAEEGQSVDEVLLAAKLEELFTEFRGAEEIAPRLPAAVLAVKAGAE